jgi:hypothetical protein
MADSQTMRSLLSRYRGEVGPIWREAIVIPVAVLVWIVALGVLS